MKIIELADIKQAINFVSDLDELILSQKKAFIDFSLKHYDVPMPMQFVFPEYHTDCHIKGGYKHDSEHLVVKIANGGTFGNNGIILVFASNTGALKTIIQDKGFLTTLRTAIAGIIVSELIPWQINTIGIMGSGHLAKMLYDLARLKYSHAPIMLYARNKIKAKLITENICYTPEALIEKCDLIFTATASDHPLIPDSENNTQKAIIALGSDDVHKKELALKVFGKSDMIIVDSKEQALKFGDVAKAISSDIISADSMVELGEILQSGKPIKTKFLIADFSGIGAQDVAITEFILSKLV